MQEIVEPGTSTEVRFSQQGSRYGILVDGQIGGIMQFRHGDGVVDRLHARYAAITPRLAVQGRCRAVGLAGILVEGAFADARARGLRVLPN